MSANQAAWRAGRAMWMAMGLLLALVAGAWADGNPLAPPPPERKIFLPDAIKPGARLYYDFVVSSEIAGKTEASDGILCIDVMAVLPDRVLIRKAGYTAADAGGFRPVSGKFEWVMADEVTGGIGWWSDPALLRQMKDTKTRTVFTDNEVVCEKKYATAVVCDDTPNTYAANHFDSVTGLLVKRDVSTGAKRPGTDNTARREGLSSFDLMSTRLVKLPWLDQKWPAWTRTVASMHYEGAMVRDGGGVMPDVRTPLKVDVAFTEHGDTWVIGTQTRQTVGQPLPPAAYACGTASTGYWIDPNALSAMKPGVIDSDDVLKLKTTYDLRDTPQGQVGIITDISTTGAFTSTACYSLTDGSMISMSLVIPDVGVHQELTLTERK